MNPKVDQFLAHSSKWREEMTLLRKQILDLGLLVEEYKWRHPCYTFNGKNVVLIHGFKEYCALLFHKGVLLQDHEGLLIQQTQNVQAARQIRFTHKEQIEEQTAFIKAYILEAIELEKAGAQIILKSTGDYAVPEEFQKCIDSDGALKTAFETLTPGRQRAYLFYFSQAKQSKTREARIDKCLPKILDGKGLTD